MRNLPLGDCGERATGETAALFRACVEGIDFGELILMSHWKTKANMGIFKIPLDIIIPLSCKPHRGRYRIIDGI